MSTAPSPLAVGRDCFHRREARLHVGNAAALVRQAERDTGDRAGLTARAREDDVLRAIGYLPPAEYEARYYQQGL